MLASPVATIPFEWESDSMGIIIRNTWITFILSTFDFNSLLMPSRAPPPSQCTSSSLPPWIRPIYKFYFNYAGGDFIHIQETTWRVIKNPAKFHLEVLWNKSPIISATDPFYGCTRTKHFAIYLTRWVKWVVGMSVPSWDFRIRKVNQGRIGRSREDR